MHEYWMTQALVLAAAAGEDVPVGAVIIKDGRLIASAHNCREKDNSPFAHAEILAMEQAAKELGSRRLTGCILYVTLEPCSHQGKTPSCTEAIIENKIHKVVIGSKDPNPLVKGIEILKENGIEVVTGVLQKECEEMNRVFFHYIKTGKPYILMKYAMTLDGKIATRSGKSKWITGEEAREAVHQTRNDYSGIMVGVNTILQDDPLLTCRIKGGRNPNRIICDTHLRTPLSSRVVETARYIPTYLATCCGDEKKIKRFKIMGVKILEIPEDKGYLNLDMLMKKLGTEGIDSILLEGGGTLNFSALKAGIVNALQVYLAPKIFGGEMAKTPVEGLGVEDPMEAYHFTEGQVKSYGEDFCLEYRRREDDVYRNC